MEARAVGTLDDLGAKVPAIPIPSRLARAAMALYASTGDEVASAAMVEALGVLAGCGSPERLCSALEAWSRRAAELKASGGNGQVVVGHSCHRGVTASLEVTQTLKF